MRKSLLLISSLLLLFVACSAEREYTSEAPELVVIFSIDTLRSDRIGAYGYEPAHTPNIDQFAADATLFESAWSPVPLTLPSHVSLFSGRMPSETGVRDNLGFDLDPSLPYLPKLLSESGYRTAGFVSSWVLRGSTGLNQIFDSWDDQIEGVGVDAVGELSRPGEETVDRAIRWLSTTSGKRFLFVHIFEPHTPYDPPAQFSGGDPYDGEVAAADDLFGRFIDSLKTNELYDDSLIVLLSDHGEGLGDHGEQEHGILLYREAIQVPLLIKRPGSRGGGTRVGSTVSLIDVAPTIAVELELKKPEFEWDGAPLTSPGLSPDRVVVSETLYPRIHLGWSELVSAVEGSSHLIDAPTVELYDLESDPAEKDNIAGDQRRVVAALRGVVADYDRSISAMSAIDPVEAEKLASLGYLSGGSNASGELPDPKDRIEELSRFQRASILLREARFDEAQPILDELVSANPGFADAWVLKGRVEEGRGRYEEAYHSYRSAVEKAPNLAAGTALSISRVLVRLGRFTEAVEHASIAESRHPEAARIATARAKLSAGDPIAAESSLGSFEVGDPMYTEATLVRSQIEVMRRRPERALALLESIERTSNGPVGSLQMLKADALARLGRTTEARRAFEREIESFPANREAYIRLMAILILAGDLDEAENVAERLVVARPDSSAEIANVFRALGQGRMAGKWESR